MTPSGNLFTNSDNEAFFIASSNLKFNVESAQISRVDKTLKIDDNKNNVGISINQLSFSYNDETDKILDNVSYNFNFPQKYVFS